MGDWIEKYLNSEEKIDAVDFFGGLGAMNTVSDFVTELYDSLFRDILGDEVMDSPLGSFNKVELFSVMSKIFLQDGNRQLFKTLVEK